MPSGTLESQLFGRGRGRKPKRPAPHHHPPRPAPAARAFVGGESMPPPNIAATEYAAAPSDASEGSSLVPTVAVAPDAASDPDRPPIKSTIGPGGAPALNRCDDTCNDAIWNNQFNDLRDFWERNGHFDVPTNWPQNSTLASWVNTQRTEYQSKQDGNTSNQPGIITQDQIDALNGLGFRWHINRTFTSAWEKRFDELRQYRTDHGDCNVPRNWAENPQLATWVTTQRTKYKNKQVGNMHAGIITQDQIDALNGLGFSWRKFTW